MDADDAISGNNEYPVFTYDVVNGLALNPMGKLHQDAMPKVVAMQTLLLQVAILALILRRGFPSRK
jgi:hypothetical protein